MPIKKLRSGLLLLFLIVILISCAKQAQLSGGPMDVEPPKFVEAIPPVGTTNFNEKRIQIKFDEYIRLNNVNQKLIISPPISEKPNVVLSGKSVKITLRPELLEPETTYLFNFNDAIADNNENNALNSFVYAFSTGDILDSLSFSGYILDAYTKKSVEDIWVILHNDISDTAIYTKEPAYLTKVDKEGNFIIPYVKENNYKIYALRDNNFNYKFDLPTEEIAFIDSVYEAGIEVFSGTDSLGNEIVSYRTIPDKLELLLFMENKQAQYIKSQKRLTKNNLEIVFNSKQYEDFNLDVIGDNQAIIYAKNNPDTVKVWITDDEVYAKDSIKIFIKYTDPIYTDSVRQDTLKFRKAEKEQIDSVINIKVNPGNLPYKDFIIQSGSPVISYDPVKIKVEMMKDSIYNEIQFSIIRDSLNPLKLKIETDEINENSEYRFIIDSAFITGINNIVNKTDTLRVKTLSSGDFGGLNINIGNENINYIVQLLENDKEVAEQVSDNGKIQFEYLKPGTYKIRVIEDLNNNKRWDTGDLKLKKQPEPVYYYPSEYEIRNNWTHEIDWNPSRNVSTGVNIDRE